MTPNVSTSSLLLDYMFIEVTELLLSIKYIMERQSML